LAEKRKGKLIGIVATLMLSTEPSPNSRMNTIPAMRGLDGGQHQQG